MYYKNFEITEENGKHFIVMDGDYIEVEDKGEAIRVIDEFLNACSLSGEYNGMKFYRTSEVECVAEGIVDFIADGVLIDEMGGYVSDVIKVKIGYGKPVTLDDYWENEAIYLFVGESFTVKGNFTVKQTIEL